MNRHAWALALYVIVQSGTDTVKMAYEGMSPQTVDGLLQERQALNPGTTYQFVSKATYDAVPDPAPNSPPDPLKIAARAIVRDTTKTVLQRLNALLFLLDMDR